MTLFDRDAHHRWIATLGAGIRHRQEQHEAQARARETKQRANAAQVRAARDRAARERLRREAATRGAVMQAIRAEALALGLDEKTALDLGLRLASAREVRRAADRARSAQWAALSRRVWQR